MCPLAVKSDLATIAAISVAAIRNCHIRFGGNNSDYFDYFYLITYYLYIIYYIIYIIKGDPMILSDF